MGEEKKRFNYSIREKNSCRFGLFLKKLLLLKSRKLAEEKMGQVIAKIRKLATFFSNGGNREINARSAHVEEVSERLLTITEDAYIITIWEDDPIVERSDGEIIPDAHVLGATSETSGNEIVPVSHTVSSSTDKSEASTQINVVARTLPALPKGKHKWIKHYCSSYRILLVGEGDFSFSACLAKAFGSATNMVATSLNSIDFLQANYAKAMVNINYLKNKGGTVTHEFDATAMYNNRHLINYGDSKFDRIIYNFPLAGFFHGLTPDRQLRRNRHLVRSFMANARKMLHDHGEIHITHKSNGFFLKWDLEELAAKCGLRLIGQVKFNLNDYPDYHTKYGFGGDNNFNCKPSKTYKFGHQ